MRLFYLINEPFLNYQLGYRDAIKSLIKTGDLEDCFFYSFNTRCRELEDNWSLVLQDILNQVANFKPSAILFAHTSNKNFDQSFFKSIEEILSYKPVYALDERDVYGRVAKRIPPQLLFLVSKCDIVFLVTSGGWMYNVFDHKKNGKLIYLPHVCDHSFFQKEIFYPGSKKYDVVMIGNLAKSRVPFKSMPGVTERIQVAKALHKKHGNRFAVFGYGWERYPFSAGPVSFFKQDEVLRESNLSIGIDHFFSYRQYFSDRLPIALYSGIPHLSLMTPDIDLLFNEEKHIFYFKNINEANHKIDRILSGSVIDLNKILDDAKLLIEEKYTEKIRMKSIITHLKISLEC